MRLRQIKDRLEARIICGDEFLDRDITMGSCSDLLSDVLVYTKAEALLLTGLTNPQVIRTSEMVDVSAICFVHGKKPEQSTVELAMEKEIPLLCTVIPMFKACGILYSSGIHDCSDTREET